MSSPGSLELSRRTAYLSMFEFLSRYYRRGNSPEIGALLGELSLLADGNSADPAAYRDFESSVETVLHAEATGGYADAQLALRATRGQKSE